MSITEYVHNKLNYLKKVLQVIPKAVERQPLRGRSLADSELVSKPEAFVNEAAQFEWTKLKFLQTPQIANCPHAAFKFLPYSFTRLLSISVLSLGEVLWLFVVLICQFYQSLLYYL